MGVAAEDTPEEPERKVDYPRRRVWLRALVIASIGFLIAILDPFEIDRHSSDASNDVFLRLIAPWVSDRAESDPIVVVLVTEDSLKRLKELAPAD